MTYVVIMVCDTPPYGHAPTYQISLTYLERNNYLTSRSKVKVQTKVILVRDTPLMHPHTKYHWPISKDKKCYGPNKNILFNKTIIWPSGQRSRSNKGHYGIQHTTLWTCTHIPNIIDLSRKTFFYCIIEMYHIPANINLR